MTLFEKTPEGGKYFISKFGITKERIDVINCIADSEAVADPRVEGGNKIKKN